MDSTCLCIYPTVFTEQLVFLFYFIFAYLFVFILVFVETCSSLACITLTGYVL